MAILLEGISAGEGKREMNFDNIIKNAHLLIIDESTDAGRYINTQTN